MRERGMACWLFIVIVSGRIRVGDEAVVKQVIARDRSHTLCQLWIPGTCNVRSHHCGHRSTIPFPRSSARVLQRLALEVSGPFQSSATGDTRGNMEHGDCTHVHFGFFKRVTLVQTLVQTSGSRACDSRHPSRQGCPKVTDGMCCLTTTATSSQALCSPLRKKKRYSRLDVC